MAEADKKRRPEQAAWGSHGFLQFLDIVIHLADNGFEEFDLILQIVHAGTRGELFHHDLLVFVQQVELGIDSIMTFMRFSDSAIFPVIRCSDSSIFPNNLCSDASIIS